MKESLKKYKKKCKRRVVDFYIKDLELYEFSKTLDFNKFVKLRLQELYEIRKELEQ